MTTSTQTPPARRTRPRVMRIVNVPMRALLGLPFRTPLSARLMLVHVTGRRTGRHYRQPVSYVRHDDTLLTPGGGNWKRNLVEGRPVKIRLGGHDLVARPELIGGVEEVGQLLEVIAADSPRAANFIPIPRHSTGQFDRDALHRAVEHGFRIVRWHLQPEPADRKS